MRHRPAGNLLKKHLARLIPACWRRSAPKQSIAEACSKIPVFEIPNVSEREVRVIDMASCHSRLPMRAVLRSNPWNGPLGLMSNYIKGLRHSPGRKVLR